MKEGKGLSLATRVAVYVALSVSLMYIISTLLIARVTDRVLMDEANKSARNMLEITSARIEQVLKMFLVVVDFVTNKCISNFKNNRCQHSP